MHVGVEGGGIQRLLCYFATHRFCVFCMSFFKQLNNEYQCLGVGTSSTSSSGSITSSGSMGSIGREI